MIQLLDQHTRMNIYMRTLNLSLDELVTKTLASTSKMWATKICMNYSFPHNLTKINQPKRIALKLKSS
jgi:hypothetical protein